MLEKSEIDLQKLKDILCEINPKDYFTQTPVIEILRNSIDFRFSIGEGECIELRFKWLEDPHEKKFSTDQLWYISKNLYNGTETRIVMIEKKDKTLQ